MVWISDLASFGSRIHTKFPGVLKWKMETLVFSLPVKKSKLFLMFFLSTGRGSVRRTRLSKQDSRAEFGRQQPGSGDGANYYGGKYHDYDGGVCLCKCFWKATNLRVASCYWKVVWGKYHKNRSAVTLTKLALHLSIQKSNFFFLSSIFPIKLFLF